MFFSISRKQTNLFFITLVILIKTYNISETFVKSHVSMCEALIYLAAYMSCYFLKWQRIYIMICINIIIIKPSHVSCEITIWNVLVAMAWIRL